MIGEWDYSHHVDPCPPKDGVIGRFDIKDAELYDDIVWICSDRKLDYVGSTGFAPVESI